MYKNLLKVGVIGYSGSVDSDPVLKVADISYKLGQELGKLGVVVLTGGRDGVMHLVSKGAAENGAVVIGITPYKDGGLTPFAIEISTGLDMAMRSGVLLNSSDVVISIGGAAGTAIEIFMAYSYRKPLILLQGTGGWTDRIIKILLEDETLNGNSLDYRLAGNVYIVKNIEDVIEIVAKYKVIKCT